jgi:S-adenosylmethionine:tRNA ribosyltransferase-isomerase
MLRVVDAVLTGTHEPGTSHYDLLQAFVTGSTLDAIDAELERYGYRTHEFGDSVLLEKARERRAIPMEPGTLSSLQLEAIS